MAMATILMRCRNAECTRFNMPQSVTGERRMSKLVFDMHCSTCGEVMQPELPLGRPQQQRLGGW